LREKRFAFVANDNEAFPDAKSLSMRRKQDDACTLIGSLLERLNYLEATMLGVSFKASSLPTARTLPWVYVEKGFAHFYN